MSAEIEVQPQPERLVRIELFAASIPVISERKPLIDAIIKVRQAREQKALIKTRRNLLVEQKQQDYQKAKSNLDDAAAETNYATKLTIHSWERDKNLPTSLLWDRLRVEFRAWVEVHPWVLKIPFLSRFPLDQLPELTIATEIEVETRKRFDEIRQALSNDQRQAEEAYQKAFGPVEDRLNQSERNVRLIVEEHIGSSREMVGLYVSVFPEELSKIASFYASKQAETPREFERLKDTFVNLIKEQAGIADETDVIQEVVTNKTRSVLRMFGTWIHGSAEDLNKPLTDLSAKKHWQEFVAYDVARECFEKNPDAFDHEPRVPKLI